MRSRDVHRQSQAAGRMAARVLHQAATTLGRWLQGRLYFGALERGGAARRTELV